MIIVTGANGFIGSAIVWQLNQLGDEDLVCVDTVSPLERPDPLAKRKYSKFLSEKQLWDFLNLPETQKSVTWVIHMGANSSTTEKNWEHLYENNTRYTQKLFQWCAQHGKSFIYASSAATYGAGELGYSDHTDSEQLKPLNLYGESKVLFDRWVRPQIFQCLRPE
jgi:ADP-L-glycero-D-manno-heptose 6-epimerase